MKKENMFKSLAMLLFFTVLFAGKSFAGQNRITGVSIAPAQTGVLTYGTGGTTDYLVTLTASGLATATAPTIAISGTALPAGVTASFISDSYTVAAGTITLPGSSVGGTVILRLTATGAVNAGTTNGITVTTTGNAAVSGPASLVIDQAPLTITADDASKCEGAIQTYAGTEFTNGTLYNADVITGVTLASTGDASGAVANTYLITPSAAVGTGLTNYNISYVDGTLTVNPTPAVDNLTDVPANMSYTLPTLINGNYFTATAGGGSPLTAGDKISSSQTIYIYADNGTCTNETDFNVSILTGIRSTDCGKVVSTLNDYLYANPQVGATHYRFRVTDVNDNSVEFTTTNYRFRLSDASTALDFGATYRISVAYSTDGGNIFGAFGRTCNVVVLSKIKSWYCGATADLAAFKASFAVAGAVKYRYQLVNGGTTLVYTRHSADNTFRLSWVSGIQPNTTYSVRVAYTLDGTTWSAYGAACSMTTPAAGMMTSEGGVESYDQNMAEELVIAVYPNPSNGDVTINSTVEGTFNIVNELGQLVQTVVVTKENNFTSKVSNLNNGIYFITGTNGGNVVTEKIIVQ